MSDSRPNIVFIMTDQQSATMMSCAGNPYVKTPAMDSLAADGMRFERAYCTDPVCIPSRLSLMTGRMPSDLGFTGNDVSKMPPVPDYVKEQGLGQLLKMAGYDVGYGGKVHLPKMNAEDVGFEYFCTDGRDLLAGACLEFATRKRDKPFMMVASFINPHDICYMAIRDFVQTDQDRDLIARGGIEIETLDEALKLPEGISEQEFFEKVCPPLPENYEVPTGEADAVKAMQAERPFKKDARTKYSDQQWRMHRWAYCQLTEKVDRQIGELLDGLKAAGLYDKTLFIFTSDHGDMDSAHRMEHKTAFYNEAARIPFIMAQPGVTKGGVVNASELVSNGLDLLPTICDYAAVEWSCDLRGRSLRGIVEGGKAAENRDVIIMENDIGRAIVTAGYKYMLHDFGENAEQLVDVKNDPGEMRNLAQDTEYQEILQEHRRLFKTAWGDASQATC